MPYSPDLSGFNNYIDGEGRMVRIKHLDRTIVFPWKDLAVLIRYLPTHNTIFKWEDGIVWKYEQYGNHPGEFRKFNRSPHLFENLTGMQYVDDTRVLIKDFYKDLRLSGTTLQYRYIPRDMLPDLEDYLSDPFENEHLSR